MSDLDALSDDALLSVYSEARSAAFDRHLGACEIGHAHAQAVRAAVLAVRDHILRVLAEQAGDLEALAEVVHDALSMKYEPGARAPYRSLAPAIQDDARRAALAVAARIRAEASLREQEYEARVKRDHEQIVELQQELGGMLIERDALVAEVLALQEALRNLRDEQNDVPLLTRERQWREAMRRADELLARPLPGAAKLEAQAALEGLRALEGES